MSLVETYVFRTVRTAFLASLGVLTAVIWITQALRQFDLLTTKGQSMITFLMVTLLTVPSLISVIAPVALFIAVLYSLNKLNSDSELIVMSAAGLSPTRLLRPFVKLTVMVTILVAIMTLWAIPWSFRELRDLFMKIRADFITNVVREGTFTTLDQGFIFHYRERGPDGSLRSLLMEDRRDPDHINSYLAEEAHTFEADDNNYLVLSKGSVQRHQPQSKDAAIVLFDRYAIDLAQFGPEGDGAPLRPRERSTRDLILLDHASPVVKQQEGRFRSELHDRFVNPLYALSFGFIAFVALGQARTTRQGRGTAILVAVGVVLLLRIAGFGASTYVVKSAAFVWLDYGIPLISLGLAAFFILTPQLRTAARDGAEVARRQAGVAAMVGYTLARYLATNFTRTILSVFATMFGLIYLIDFVELLRRAGDAQGATTSAIAWVSLMRVPAIAEQILPFAVLFGAMFAFLNLTRKLELVVARAAGVSVWQFLLPPVVIALLLGVITTTLYNPLSAVFKQRAARIEAKLFGRTGSEGSDVAFWIQQNGVDGQTILRADRASEGGTVLSGVTAFCYDRDKTFMERVEADQAVLRPGFWRLENARVLTPGEPPRDVGAQLIATNVTSEEVQQKFVPPDAVPFWGLPQVRDQLAKAGLNATEYDLQYQALLARPLLFVAMILVAASFSLRFFRFGGVARMVAGGVSAGFVLYVSTKLIGDLGNAGLLSASMAAWTPAIVGSMLSSLALLYQEDG